jgi:hypothetical protein
MKNNAGAQFLVGCFVIAAAIKFYSMGVFDQWFYPDQSEGIEGSIGALAVSGVIAAVQWVGYAAILLVSGLQPVAESIVDMIKAKLPGRAKETTEIDGSKLNEALTSIIERLDRIEGEASND